MLVGIGDHTPLPDVLLLRFWTIHSKLRGLSVLGATAHQAPHADTGRVSDNGRPLGSTHGPRPTSHAATFPYPLRPWSRLQPNHSIKLRTQPVDGSFLPNPDAQSNSQEHVTSGCPESGPTRTARPHASSNTDGGAMTDPCPVLTLAAVRQDAHTTTWCKPTPKTEGRLFTT